MLLQDVNISGGDVSAAVTYDAGSPVTERRVAAVPEKKNTG